MSKKHMISIAEDFSVYPGGRTPEDGDFSGQEFRDNILIPALRKYDMVEVNLDGTRGYGSSFLEESFGGLLRNGFTFNEVKRKLLIISSRNSFKEEIEGYIAKASEAN
jgi:hypothetical protein